MQNHEHEERFRFPDEKEKPEELQIEVEGEGETEIEVVDDTPEPDRNRAPMKEAPAEVTDDELAQYSEGVKKRIQHFSKGYHEERRAKESALREREEALRLAQNLVEENKRLQGSLGQGQQALLEQAKKVVANEVASAKTRLKEAHEAFDTDGIVAAQEELAKAVNKAERVNSFRPPVAKPEEPVVQPAPRAEPQVEAKALAWRDSNPWFGSDDEMTAVALTVHRKLVESGVSTASDEYYEKINSRVRQLFPDAFPSEKPVKKSVVAPATRSTAPRKIVLTQSQVQIAKRLGLTNEQYARAVAEEMRKQNG
jgi:hypothetical protein